jgi:rhizosphere induced protein
MMTFRGGLITLSHTPSTDKGGSMPNSYSLTVINDSELTSPTFAVFAVLPVTADYSSLSLAWLTQQIDATNQYVFQWDITWGFAWAGEGTQPTYQWNGSGSLAADPTSPTECAASFTWNGDFQLLPAQGIPTGYTLSITDSPTIPIPSKQPSSVAVTLGGNSVCATNAGPNLTQEYTLHPTYFIDAGNYVQGQMVDGASVTAFQELEYSGGNTALTATLGQQNTWTVTPSASFDYSALFAKREVSA